VCVVLLLGGAAIGTMKTLRRSLSFSREPKAGSNAPATKYPVVPVPDSPPASSSSAGKLKRSLSFGSRPSRSSRASKEVAAGPGSAAVPVPASESFKRLTASEVAAGAQLAPSFTETSKRAGAPLQKRSNSFGRHPKKEVPAPTPPLQPLTLTPAVKPATQENLKHKAQKQDLAASQLQRYLAKMGENDAAAPEGDDDARVGDKPATGARTSGTLAARPASLSAASKSPTSSNSGFVVITPPLRPLTPEFEPPPPQRPSSPQEGTQPPPASPTPESAQPPQPEAGNVSPLPHRRPPPPSTEDAAAAVAAAAGNGLAPLPATVGNAAAASSAALPASTASGALTLPKRSLQLTKAASDNATLNTSPKPINGMAVRAAAMANGGADCGTTSKLSISRKNLDNVGSAASSAAAVPVVAALLQQDSQDGAGSELVSTQLSTGQPSCSRASAGDPPTGGNGSSDMVGGAAGSGGGGAGAGQDDDASSAIMYMKPRVSPAIAKVPPPISTKEAAGVATDGAKKQPTPLRKKLSFSRDKKGRSAQQAAPAAPGDGSGAKSAPKVDGEMDDDDLEKYLQHLELTHDQERSAFEAADGGTAR